MTDQDVTLGEVYRLCKSISQQLEAIDTHVQHHETRIAVLEDRENRGAKLGGIWGAVGGVISGFVSGFLGKGT